MDMVINITAMNKLNQIRASNPLLNFRKAHSKQDNIWDKQYTENRRNELKEQISDLLKRCPSKEEVVEAWKSGIELIWREELAWNQMTMVNKTVVEAGVE